MTLSCRETATLWQHTCRNVIGTYNTTIYFRYHFAYEIFSRSLSIRRGYDATDVRDLAQSANNLGRCAYALQRFDEARDLFLFATSLLEDATLAASDYQDLTASLVNLGRTYCQQNDIQVAKDLFNGINVCNLIDEEQNRTSTKILIYNNLARLHIDHNDPQKAVDHLTDAMHLIHSLDNEATSATWSTLRHASIWPSPSSCCMTTTAH